MGLFFKRGIAFLSISILFYELFAGLTSPIFSFRQFYTDVQGFFENSTTNHAIEDKKKNFFKYDPDGKRIKIRINNVGFNSHRDYDSDKVEQSIFVIGDSFVESSQVGTFNSIGYLLEKSLDSVDVVSFGKGGGHIHTYNNIYNQYDLKKAKKVIIVITGINDLIWVKKEKSKINRANSKFLKKINSLINGPKKLASPNYSYVVKNSNIIYVIHDNLSKEAFRNHNIHNEIIQLNLSNRYRLSDGHYNKDGNKLIVEKIKPFLN